jgi:hypothetical protein
MDCNVLMDAYINLDKSQGIFVFLHVCIYILFSADMSTERVKWFIYLYIYWDENNVMISDHG